MNTKIFKYLLAVLTLTEKKKIHTNYSIIVVAIDRKLNFQDHVFNLCKKESAKKKFHGESLPIYVCF